MTNLRGRCLNYAGIQNLTMACRQYSVHSHTRTLKKAKKGKTILHVSTCLECVGFVCIWLVGEGMSSFLTEVTLSLSELHSSV